MIGRDVAFGVVYATLLVAGVAHSRDAHAAFSCGPYALTYRVISDAGLSGGGVRCVAMGRGDFSWYGEGIWQNPDFNPLKYRHYGMAEVRGSTATGQAADLYGNGEKATWRAFNRAPRRHALPASFASKRQYRTWAGH